MKIEEVAKKIQAIMDGSGLNCVIAIQSDNENKVSLCSYGDEQHIGGCLMAILGSGQISEFGLGILGAYGIALSKGLVGFEDAEKFSEYLSGCADVYFQHSKMIGPSKKGMS